MGKSITSNFLWRFGERFFAQLVTLIVSIILARLLEPSAYGVVAIVSIFVSLVQTFIDSGLGNALIQKKNASSEDFSTVFYFNLILCFILYSIIWMASPVIAAFYENMDLVLMIRVISLSIFISGLKNIQQAYVARNMIFKKFFFATFLGTIISAIVGIYLAYKGAGAWALIMQQLTNNFVDMVILWIVVKWRPSLEFSFLSLRRLFSYGWKLTAADFIGKCYDQIRDLVIGKKYSSSDLAFFTKGKQFPHILITNINTSMDSVLLPAMSNVQDIRTRVKELARKSIVTSTFLLFPMLIGLACCSDLVIKVLLGDKWLPCVPYLRIFCIISLFYPLHTSNLNAIKSVGRSDIYFVLDVIKKSIGLIILLITYKYGPFMIAIGMIFDSLFSLLLNAYPTKKLIDYGLLSQVRDISQNMVYSIIMGVIVFIIDIDGVTPIFVLIVKVFTGVAVYFLICKITNYKVFNSYLFKLKSLWSKK